MNRSEWLLLKKSKMGLSKIHASCSVSLLAISATIGMDSSIVIISTILNIATSQKCRRLSKTIILELDYGVLE
jgi:hypothetical protein